MINTRLLASLASTLFATTVLAGATAASAQSAGITGHELDPRAAAEAFRDGAPGGPFQSRMPLADNSAFEPAGPGSGISGTPGVSAMSGTSEPEAYGSSAEGAPYTTARVAVQKPGESRKKKQIPVTGLPFSATGKLYMTFGNSTFVCTASLIRKGILITAAHCVHNFGQGSSGFADSAIWYPAQFKGSKNGQPFGGFKARNIFVPTPYIDGTDTCTQAGVVCNNDVATIALMKQKIKYKNVKGKDKSKNGYPGEVVGMYDYGYNGYSYVTSPALGGEIVVQITQLGYPVAFDKGDQMQRTDAVGWYHDVGVLKNTQIGSAQTGGSSGGPWLTNFGTRPSVSSGASLGFQSVSNVVVGVTSYGSSTVGYNRQGASYFGQNFEFPLANYGGWGAGNIGALMQATCAKEPKSC